MIKWALTIIVTFILWAQFDGLKKPIESIVVIIGLGLVLSHYDGVKEQFRQFAGGASAARSGNKTAAQLSPLEIVTLKEWADTPLGKEVMPNIGGSRGIGSTRSF